jgi:hypothetical protein
MKTQGRVILSLICGVVLSLTPLLIERLEQRFGYNPQVGMVGDALWMPGQFLARLIFPEGVHTGSGSPAFIPLSLVANAVVFTVLAFLLIQLAAKRKAATV